VGIYAIYASFLTLSIFQDFPREVPPFLYSDKANHGGQVLARRDKAALNHETIHCFLILDLLYKKKEGTSLSIFSFTILFFYVNKYEKNRLVRLILGGQNG